MKMREVNINRPTLGPFMSVVCFRYLHDDAMDLAGQALIVDAGRQRGQDLIDELGIAGQHQVADAIHKDLHDALGPDGTRLCIINSISERDGGGFEVHSSECASPIYTLGVLIGAISSITGQTMIGKHMGKEDGTEEHVYHIEPL